jgi:hypothetical protein
MASSSRISNALCRAMLDNAVNALLNEEIGPSIVNIYSGSIPAQCEDAESGTLLATTVMSDTPFPAASDQNPGAQIAANAIAADITAVAGGTASHYRCYTTTGGSDATKVTCHIQGSAGEAADSTDMTLDNKVIVAGGTVQITAWTIDLPET